MVGLKVTQGSSKQTPAPLGSSKQMPASQDSGPTWAQRIRRMLLPYEGGRCMAGSSAGAWLLRLSFSGTPAAKAVVSPPPRLSSTELWESEKDSQAKVPGLESPQRTTRDPGRGSRCEKCVLCLHQFSYPVIQLICSLICPVPTQG